VPRCLFIVLMLLLSTWTYVDFGGAVHAGQGSTESIRSNNGFALLRFWPQAPGAWFGQGVGGLGSRPAPSAS